MQPLLLMAGMALLLVGCDLVDDDPEVVTLTGIWEGEVERGEIEVIVELSLEQPTEMEVSGSGLLEEDGEDAAFAVTNSSYVHPALSMQWQFDDRPPISFGGTVDDELEEIDGTLSGAGFGDDSLTLRRR